MERRYLVATLALVATFAVFSREFRSGHLANLPCSRAEMVADLACAKRYVADRMVANMRPFVHRGVPEEAQMMAELNLPVLAAVNEQLAEAQAAVAQKTAEKECEAARRAQVNTERAQAATERPHEISARAQELSARAAERAQELSIRANERAAEINARAIERAQRINACAMERAQRALERSRSRMAQPKVEGYPIPINFEVVSPSDFALPMQVSVESRLAVDSVKARVAAEQFRALTVQRANQKIMNNVQVVVTTEDVSGVDPLKQFNGARTLSRQIERAIQHSLQNISRAVDRTFATI